MQINTLINSATKTLAQHSVDTPRLESELLLTSVLKVNRSALYTCWHDSLSKRELEKFNRSLQRRMEGCPIAYLLGVKEFWSMELAVSEKTFIPRPETECLVEAALGLLAQQTAPNILELGTGTGAIALALAKEKPDARIWATDLDRAVLALAQANAQSHGLDKIQFWLRDFMCGDGLIDKMFCGDQKDFAPLPPQGFDLIISNPPYIAEHDSHLVDLSYEPKVALVSGNQGLDAIKRITHEAWRYLCAGGVLMLEHGATQAGRVREYLQVRYHAVNTLTDLAGLDRITYGQVMSSSYQS